MKRDSVGKITNSRFARNKNYLNAQVGKFDQIVRRLIMAVWVFGGMASWAGGSSNG